MEITRRPSAPFLDDFHRSLGKAFAEPLRLFHSYPSAAGGRSLLRRNRKNA
jgi:hypothetical protein